MRGKLVNAIVGGMNFVFGILALLFKFYLPSLSVATQQEIKVVTEVNSYVFILMIVVALFNFVTLIFNCKDKIFLFSYVLAILSSCFYFLDFNYIGVLYILAALLIEIQVLRENVIFTNSTIYIVCVSVVIVAIGIAAVNLLTYKDRVEKIVKQEAKGYVEYQESYFKNISVLDEDAEFYINVKRDGKWGYVNSNGDVKIDFEYDYASPFITISKYDKNFDIALVCKDDVSSIILKNKRNVMTFKNEISIDDYDAQFQKLKDLYVDTFKQTDDIENNINLVDTSNMKSIDAYEGFSYRYPFNDEYDIYITVSQIGGKNRYEFLKKDNPNIKVSIDCDNLKFDERHLYVFSNGYLPFYKTSENIQGWYTKETKRVEINGNIQILDFFDQNILMKDYDSETVYFANEGGERISPVYKDIFVLNEMYIVKNEENKYIIIDKNFNKVLDIEYDYMNPIFLNKGILICANLPAKVNFNSYGFPNNINYDLIDVYGKKITLKNVDGSVIDNPSYTEVFYLSNKKTVSNYDSYISNLTDIKYDFVGDEFYKK